MPHTRDEVLSILGQQEPDLDFWRALEPSDIPELARIAAGNDLLLAARAVVVAARLDPSAAEPLALLASRRKIHQLRLASVSAAEYLLPEVAAQIVNRALDETDPAMLKFALRVAKSRRLSQLKPKIQNLMSETDSSHIQKLAQDIWSEL